jgi:hypothetical protein
MRLPNRFFEDHLQKIETIALDWGNEDSGKNKQLLEMRIKS